MTIGVESPPPRIGSHRRGRGPWTELVTVCDPIEADYLLSRLYKAGISTRLLAPTSDGCANTITFPRDVPATIYVQVAQLDEARFVLVSAAYDAPPARHAPFAEKGIGHYVRAFAWIPALLASVMLIAGAIVMDEPGSRCGYPVRQGVGQAASKMCPQKLSTNNSVAKDRTGERIQTKQQRMDPSGP